MPQFSDNLRGAAYMVLAMLGFVLNDAIMKLVSSDLHLYQAIFLRGVLATAMMGFLAWRSGGFATPRNATNKFVVLRTIGELGGTVFFLTALFNMELANAGAILQAMPLVVTLAAALILRETVGWRRYSAITVGLLGVLIIIRPGGDGFNIFSLSALAAVFCLVLRDLATRGIPRDMSSNFISFVAAASVMIMGAIVTLFGEWQPVSALTLLKLTASALFLMAGYFWSIQAMRFGEVSFTSPFRYTSLIWAIVLGYMLFGDIPDVPMIIGSIIVVASGLFTLYREQKMKQSKAREIKAASP
ncbi:DMT family transporter [Pararhizobium sp. IMCC21322]|uniref:DMT family transporter n=1 Tax=Pararhizobium sp. IMCC21322 TaxID=3067903 RepID=UPI0027411C2F|nr:DMT family transporter [Pararhizobium sp. IMCC21322]